MKLRKITMLIGLVWGLVGCSTVAPTIAIQSNGANAKEVVMKALPAHTVPHDQGGTEQAEKSQNAIEQEQTKNEDAQRAFEAMNPTAKKKEPGFLGASAEQNEGTNRKIESKANPIKQKASENIKHKKWEDQSITIYLTIDDGFQKVEAFLKWKEEVNVPITLFLTSDAMLQHQELWRQWLSHPDVLLGNHTKSHRAASKLNTTQFEQELRSWEKTVHQHYGASCANSDLFRFPYGDIGAGNQQAFKNILKERGYQMWGWDLDLSYPFKSRPGHGETLAKKILNTAKKTEWVVLLHFIPEDLRRLKEFHGTLTRSDRTVVFKLLPSNQEGNCLKD